MKTRRLVVSLSFSLSLWMLNEQFAVAQKAYVCGPGQSPCVPLGVGKNAGCDSVDRPGGYPYAYKLLDVQPSLLNSPANHYCSETPPKSAAHSSEEKPSESPTAEVSRPAVVDPPQPTAAEKAADRLLNSADRLLDAADRIDTNPTQKAATLTYISFANHNGLKSDGTWGVGMSNANPNDADAQALSQCNASVNSSASQCSSDSSCILQTGKWAAHAVSTGPFINSDGPYVTATSCGLSTQAAAQSQVLQKCQTSFVQCNLVWSGVGK